MKGVATTCRWAFSALIPAVALAVFADGPSAVSAGPFVHRALQSIEVDQAGLPGGAAVLRVQTSQTEIEREQELVRQKLLEQRRADERELQRRMEQRREEELKAYNRDLERRRAAERGEPDPAAKNRAALQFRVLALRDEARRAGAPPFASAQEIVGAINDYKRKIRAAEGGRDADEIHLKLAADLCVRLEATEIRGWTGKPIRLAVNPNSYDTLPLTAKVDEGLSLSTIDSRQRDENDENQIRRGTPVFAAISGLKLEDTIRVSGRFVVPCNLNALERDTAYYDLGFRFTAIEKN